MRIRYAVTVFALATLLLGACSSPEAAAPADSSEMVEPTTVPATEPAMTEDAADEEATTEEASTEEAAANAMDAEDEAGEEPAEEAMDEGMAETEDEAMADADEASEEVARPAWQQLPLTNAHTGESFTLADFAGKTVYVEPFATWCTNCRQQLQHVNAVSANFGDDVVFIALSVEPNIGDAALVQYANDQGFDLIFAAMSPELLRETVAIFGQTITNPPATPHFVIYADGSTTELFTGIESAAEITSLLQSSQG